MTRDSPGRIEAFSHSLVDPVAEGLEIRDREMLSVLSHDKTVAPFLSFVVAPWLATVSAGDIQETGHGIASIEVVFCLEEKNTQAVSENESGEV